MDEVKLAADLRVELRDQAECLAKAEAAIERVLAKCDEYDARAKRHGIIRHLSTGQVRALLSGEEA